MAVGISHLSKHQKIYFFKFSNYLHHLEFEESQINLEGIKKIIKEKKNNL